MSRHRLAFYTLCAGLVLAIFVAAVVLTARPTLLTGLGGGGQCRAAAAAAAAVAPLATGKMAVFRTVSPVDLRRLPYDNTGAAAKTLADFAGRTVLLNLWATWCPPCRVEMPWLAALHSAESSDRFEVVAVSIDNRDSARPEAFLAETGAGALAYHREPTLGLFRSLRNAGLAGGMPTTILIAADGCAVGLVGGAAAWDSPEAAALVQAAVAAQ